MQAFEKESGERWRTRAAVLFVAVVAVGAAWLALRYAVAIALPFLIAWGVGALVYPVAERMSRRWRLPRGLCAAVLMLLFLGLVTALLIAGADTLLSEVQHLLTRLEAEGDSIGARLAELVTQMREITSRIPWLDRLRRVEGFSTILDHVDELVNDLLRKTLQDIGQKIPEWVGRIVRAIPSALLFLIVTLLSSYYFSTDLAAIHRALRGLLPPRLSANLPSVKRRIGTILRQYARAYLLILVITFLELYVALSILGIEYAFLIAVGVALVDMLPLFGVGIVLLPWAAVMLFGRNFYIGIGLLITYGTVLLVRQIVEPRVVAGSLGLHPLLTLFCMYAGYRLFGVLGMILSPAAAILLAGLCRADQSSSGP